MNNEISQKLTTLSHNGIFHILAFDHRGSFKKMMQAHTSAEVTDADAINLKKAIIAPLADLMSGVLIDQDYGLPAYKALGARASFFLPTEKTGYVDTAGERITELEYPGASLVDQGAGAMKILIYANKNVPTWEQQVQTCKKAYEDAHDNALPLFLEFVLYTAGDVASGTITEVLTDAKSKGVSADVWKIPYPATKEACIETSSIVEGTPWVLLTGGSSFEEFVRQYEIAKSNGAAGFVAGRALWQDACALWQKPEELEAFLNTTLVERFKTLMKFS